jgi:hypothetical protein
MQASVRYSEQSSRRFMTPVMGMRGLYRLFLFVKYEFDCSYDNWGVTRTRGRKVHTRLLDKALCSGLHATFKAFHDGDRSIIEKLQTSGI